MPRPGPTQVIKRLNASSNPNDQRKGFEIGWLLELSETLWRGRFGLIDFGVAPDRSIVVACAFQANGLASVAGQIQPHDQWMCTLAFGETYPMSMPSVQFVRAIPYAAHVVHPAHLPDLSGLPADLAAYIRQGEGHCCYLRGSQWRPAVTEGNAALVCFQLSRIVTFAAVWGEAGTLNSAARDYALRLAEQNGTPLGPSLPYPVMPSSDVLSARFGGDAPEQNDDSIEWVEPNSQAGGS